ncbi:MAG: hypothetical protein QOF44_606, partial [Streptomyces sp.]|nr:hypothetical protein [Streptomyces sp.]
TVGGAVARDAVSRLAAAAQAVRHGGGAEGEGAGLFVA